MMPWLTVGRMIAVLLLPGMLCTLSPEIQAATPQLAAGAQHSVALHADGTLYAWGDNTHGQLGSGEAGEGLLSTRPVRVQNLTEIVALVARANHNLALRADGTVWAWGQNDQGQLGDGSRIDRSTPVQVSGLTGVATIATGWKHSLAVRSDGTLWVWGANDGGRFGNGSAGWGEVSTTPTRVLALSDVIAAAAGYGQSFAIKSDGTLWAWGDNSEGKLGLGTFSEIETLPLQVTNLRNVTGIMAHAGHVMAQTGDGRLWSWGADNGAGQLGNGSTEPSALPVAVLQPNGDPTAFSLGWAHSVARFMDGRLWIWGNNWYGQLGLGEVDHQLSPVQVETSTTVEAIAAGEYHTLAMTTDGDVWAWGAGGQGRLGQGEGEFNQTLPRQVLDPDGTAFLNLLQTPSAEARLAVDVAGSGRVHDDSGTIDCPGVCEAMFSTDQEIRLSATPDFGWSFAGWGGSCTGALDCLLTLDGPTTVTANFTQQSNRYQLDSPVNGSFESGIGVVYGWVCEADRIDIRVDDHTSFSAAYGAERADSEDVCGDTANGFAAAINWNDYGDGTHTLNLLADGQVLTTAEVRITTLGDSYITGLTATTRVPDFPGGGLATTLVWSEPHQNFVVSTENIASMGLALSAIITGRWESPLAESVESGQALIRGWACGASTISVELDGKVLTLPYGSGRDDTRIICGDANNGYALAINWNDYGDGQHQLTLAIDGTPVETRRFNVATPAGQGTVSGVQSRHEVSDFPHPGDALTLQWSEPHQNYRIVRYTPGYPVSDYDGQVFTLFIGYFGRPPSPNGRNYYGQVMEQSNGNWAIIADDFWNSDESRILYPPSFSTRERINLIYNNLFGRNAAPEGLAYWEGLIMGGVVSLPEMAYTIAYNASADDLAVLQAKRITATSWSDSLDTAAELEAFATSTGQQAARTFLARVNTATPASQGTIDQAIAEMVAGTQPGRENFGLITERQATRP